MEVRAKGNRFFCFIPFSFTSDPSASSIGPEPAFNNWFLRQGYRVRIRFILILRRFFFVGIPLLPEQTRFQRHRIGTLSHEGELSGGMAQTKDRSRIFSGNKRQILFLDNTHIPAQESYVEFIG